MLQERRRLVVGNSYPQVCWWGCLSWRSLLLASLRLIFQSFRKLKGISIQMFIFCFPREVSDLKDTYLAWGLIPAQCRFPHMVCKPLLCHLLSNSEQPAAQSHAAPGGCTSLFIGSRGWVKISRELWKGLWRKKKATLWVLLEHLAW